MLASFLEMTIRAWWQAAGKQEGEMGRAGDGETRRSGDWGQETGNRGQETA
jgi:hypothetical protein